MKITKDSQRQLNLHPLTVYFMLTPEENEEYGEMLLTFNDKKELTFGLFEFQTLVWANNEDDPDLSDDINALQKKNNIMVRLFDDEDGNYQYATQKLKLNDGYADIAYSVNTFMTKVYKNDYALLKGQGDATAAVFETLYKQNNGTLGLKSMPLCDGLGSNLNAGPQWMVDGLIKNEGLSEDQAKRKADELWDIYETRKENNDVSLERYRDMSVEIKYVKNPSTNLSYLITEFNVNGKIISMYVGNLERRFFVIASLLRKKLNKHLYYCEFREYKKTKIKPFEYVFKNQWVHRVYDIVNDSKSTKRYNVESDRNFDEWTSLFKTKTDRWRTAKNRLNDNFNKLLAKECGISALNFCLVKTHTDAEGRDFYEANIKPENIIVCKEFKELLDNFDELVRIK